MDWDISGDNPIVDDETCYYVPDKDLKKIEAEQEALGLFDEETYITEKGLVVDPFHSSETFSGGKKNRELDDEKSI